MDFVVHTPDSIYPISGSFKVQNNGTLVVMDPERDMQTTFSPSGWSRVEEKLPEPPAQVMPQRIR